MQVLMLNMFLLIAAINLSRLIGAFFFKKKLDYSQLSCGIVAYCGSVPADANIIRMLMMFNMERGEDGTGWAVNNVVTKDTDKVSRFISKHPLAITPQDENFTLVAHARKASSGSKLNKELVHPFAIYKGGVEKERPDLILAMNGTLNNTDLMAEEFDIEYKQYTNSDTQVIARAIAKLGPKEYIKVIQSYDGTATLVFFTPSSPNTLMIFKDPEKPLFAWQKDKDQMYISSIDDAFKSVGAKDEDICSFDNGFLFRINKGKVTKKDHVERSPLKPRAKYTKRSSYVPYHQGRMYERQTYGASTSIESDDINGIEITKGNIKEQHTNKGNNVYVWCDKYYRTGHALNGKFKISDKGELDVEDDATTKEYFFIYGYMCKDEKEYDKLYKKCADEKGMLSLKKFKTFRLSEMSHYLTYPCIAMVKNKEEWILSDDYTKLLKGIGSDVEVDMFLSKVKYTLRYKGEWTPTTNRELCTLTKMEDKEIKPINTSCVLPFTTNIMKINQKVNEADQREFLRTLITDDPFQSPHYYYSIMRADVYKCNPDSAVRSHFFTTLLRLLLDLNIIDEDQFANCVKEGRPKEFSSPKSTEKIDEFLNEYWKSHDLTKGGSSKKDEKESKISKLIGLTSEEKLRRFDDLHGEFSEEEIINSIITCNNVYNDKQFQEDVIDLKVQSFGDLLVKYEGVNDDKLVCEAMLLCINNLGNLSNNDLLKWIEMDDRSKKARAETYFKDWVSYWNQVNSTEEDVRTENDGDQDSSEIVMEQITPSEYEEECRLEVQRIIDDIVATKERISSADSSLKTDVVYGLVHELDCQIKFLRRKLVVN